MPAHANAGKMHCRLHKLRFTGEDQPNFDDIVKKLPGGRCRSCIYPGRPGSAHLALADEDMELKAEDPRACFQGFYIGICKDHAELVFRRAVRDRVCRGPSCNPVGQLEKACPGLGVARVGQHLWCEDCCAE